MKPIRWAICAALLLVVRSAIADLTLTLPNDFIEKYKNRATITTEFKIHFVHKSPKKPSPSHPANDGDIHISGLASELLMPAVAELMNAAGQPKALAYTNKMKGQKVQLTGVWRFWPEHGGDDDFRPVMQIVITNTNPDHIFEIHPLAEIGGIETLTSFHVIPGFKPKDAEDAFTRYENIRARIYPLKDSTKIRMGIIGCNYVKVRFRLREDPTHIIKDGLTVFADVKEVGGETLVRRRRMVFVEGTRQRSPTRSQQSG